MTPRVLVTADDEELVGALVALEDAERYWVNLLVADRQAVIGGTARGVIRLLEAIGSLWGVLMARAPETIEEAIERAP